MKAITVDGLTKGFKGNPVLKDVNFTVQSGEIFALLGSNGAGKTTTINILTTLMAADGGKAVVNGFDVATQPEKIRQSISLTGQFAAVDDMLTARENLEMISDLRHVKNPAQTAKELLEEFDLVDAADRNAATFSGGMRRRLDIAMSLIGNPPLIFLDEPTTGLDPEARTNMWQTIKDLNKNGTTIFLTTQYLEEADQLADTIAVLHEGTIVANGTSSELKKLVPGGLIRLTFANEKQRIAAAVALKKAYQITDTEGAMLTVDAGGDAAKIADLFMHLRDAKLEIVDFSQQVPTLDDVFFKLTGTNKEDK
ncbi:ATP-binding cassette domain-containing protein [Streptomyces caniscabiei]|uniref:ATP-binding cassette domain-containing protein n=1 Tax=Streptomyces caniscabiei TaxID=2746961 RepID=UPI0029A97C80|nr:ATP-binding cassette domain-containing protein [Streptomyces caniscabiei]MDX2776138.1 ATP-binding cassette domain-containing protein [Streptomyces caniscabiei]